MEEEIIIKYNLYKRIFISIIFLFILYFGIVIILMHNMLTILFGLLFVLTSLLRLFDFIFFKKLILGSNYISKEWFLFGKLKINIIDIKVTSVHRIWTSNIFFKSLKFGFLKNIMMSIELYPVSSNKKKYIKIKEFLVLKQIIKGDEYEWIN